MSEAKHTPGPWLHYTEHAWGRQAWSKIWTSRGPGHGCVADVAANCPPLPGTEAYFESLANARLIAAAPDLLAACRAALDDPPPVALRPDVVRKLSEAIAKAKGGA